MSLIPASSAYTDAYNGYLLVGFASAMIAILTSFVTLRFVARRVSRTTHGIDDYLTIPALLTSIALCGVSIGLVTKGGGGHHLLVVVETEPEVLINLAKLEIAFACCYLTATTFPKLAMLCLFLRIFVAQWSRYACYVLITILSLTLTANLLVAVMQCMPLGASWNPTGHPGYHCIDVNLWWRWGQLPNIVTDVFMIALPFPVLAKLSTSWKDKIGITLTFAAGSTGLVTSILRFTAFFTTNGNSSTADATWAVIKLAIYSIAEAGVYLIASCLPLYRSLYLTVKRRVPTARSSRNYFAGWRKTASAEHDGKGTPLSPYPPVRGKSAAFGFKSPEGDDESYLMDESHVVSSVSRSEG